jgi:hypothetical protein
VGVIDCPVEISEKKHESLDRAGIGAGVDWIAHAVALFPFNQAGSAPTSSGPSGLRISLSQSAKARSLETAPSSVRAGAPGWTRPSRPSGRG